MLNASQNLRRRKTDLLSLCAAHNVTHGHDSRAVQETHLIRTLVWFARVNESGVTKWKEKKTPLLHYTKNGNYRWPRTRTLWNTTVRFFFYFFIFKFIQTCHFCRGWTSLLLQRGHVSWRHRRNKHKPAASNFVWRNFVRLKKLQTEPAFGRIIRIIFAHSCRRCFLPSFTSLERSGVNAPRKPALSCVTECSSLNNTLINVISA